MKILILILFLFFSKNIFGEEIELYCECTLNQISMFTVIDGDYGDLEEETEKCTDLDFEISINVIEKIVKGNNLFFTNDPLFSIPYEEIQNDIVFNSTFLFGKEGPQENEYHKMRLNRKSGKLIEEIINYSFADGTLVGGDISETYYICRKIENIF